MVLSHQNWFLGSVRELAKKMHATLNPVPDELVQLFDMLQLGTKAGYDAQQLMF